MGGTARVWSCSCGRWMRVHMTVCYVVLHFRLKPTTLREKRLEETKRGKQAQSAFPGRESKTHTVTGMLGSRPGKGLRLRLPHWAGIVHGAFGLAGIVFMRIPPVPLPGRHLQAVIPDS